MLHLEPEELREIQRILEFWAPGAHAFAFGSRVHGRALKPTSDLDICLRGDQAIDPDMMRQLRNAFEVSSIPFRVDVIDWNDISEDFRSAIRDDLTPLGSD